MAVKMSNKLAGTSWVRQSNPVIPIINYIKFCPTASKFPVLTSIRKATPLPSFSDNQKPSYKLQPKPFIGQLIPVGSCANTVLQFEPFSCPPSLLEQVTN